MTRVKICGLKRVEDALVAAQAGADLLGFVFAPSRRQIDPELARTIIAEVRASSAVKMVGVFVNAEPEEMNRVASYCGLDYIQLHGDEPAETAMALDVPAIQAIRVGADMTAEELEERACASSAEFLLFDAAEPGVYGGTGKTFDWSRVPELDRPVLLAGGLHAGNVAAAIRVVRPWGVDVSSGVETNGEKDQGKIRDLVRLVRRRARESNL